MYRLYPYRTFLKDGITTLESLLKSINITPESNSESSQSIFANLSTLVKRDIQKSPGPNHYIETNYQNNLIQEMLQTAKVTDFCLIGPAGCGKSISISKVAEVLGLDIENIILYQDMTARDLLQQRTTLPNGDTVWKLSPLVSAALDGKIAVLDGLHRIHPSTLSVLHR